MAKMKKNGPPEFPPLPDFQNLPKVTNWQEYFDPRRKKRPEIDLTWAASWIIDWDFFKAIWITHLIVTEVHAGVDGVNSKTANPGAIAEWRGLLLPFIYARLKAGGNWDDDGANVLKVAHDMGTIAGLLAGGKPEAGPNQLKSAFAASKAHDTCSAGSGVGGGAWCTFNWI